MVAKRHLTLAMPPKERMRVRQLAAQQGISISHLLKTAARQYMAAVPVQPALQPLTSATPLLPSVQRAREDSGKSEPVKTLVRIDQERRAEPGEAFAD